MILAQTAEMPNVGFPILIVFIVIFVLVVIADLINMRRSDKHNSERPTGKGEK